MSSEAAAVVSVEADATTAPSLHDHLETNLQFVVRPLVLVLWGGEKVVAAAAAAVWGVGGQGCPTFAPQTRGAWPG